LPFISAFYIAENESTYDDDAFEDSTKVLSSTLIDLNATNTISNDMDISIIDPVRIFQFYRLKFAEYFF
jgi:hypothetical protein